MQKRMQIEVNDFNANAEFFACQVQRKYEKLRKRF